jgi:uncharacterized membrane protein YdfJ with MMPL/SSD domain
LDLRGDQGGGRRREHDGFLKLMGVGVAAVILVDATIVRMVLVPAVMQLMGRANWWTPRWLDRVLPRFDGDVRPEPVAHAENLVSS